MLRKSFQRMRAAVEKARVAVANILAKIPFWPDIVRLAAAVVAPVVKLAQVVLRTFPSLRRLEWLLEIESLTRRHPVPLALTMLYIIWRGLQPTPHGHIGTDPLVYPLLAAISGFNPFLGLTCGALYGVGDLIQKLVWPDIYGAEKWKDPNYWAAIGGYTVAYSTTMCMGVLPGMSARVLRLWTRMALRAILFRRAAAGAEGADLPDKHAFLKYYNPKTQTFHLNFKDPKVQEVVSGLAADPRNLLVDRDSWRQHELTPEQKLVMAQLRGRGLLDPQKRSQLEELVSEASSIHGEPLEGDEQEESGAPPEPAPRTLGEDDRYAFAEFLALLVGGGAGAYLTMDIIAPQTSKPAFLWRPNPDHSCLHLEVGTWLHGRAHIGAAGGALGGALTSVAPLPGAGPSAAGPQVPTTGLPTEGPLEEDVEQATNLQNELNERVAWLDKLRRDLEGFRETHQWESDYEERMRSLQLEVENEEKNISGLQRRLESLGVAPNPEELNSYGYDARYHAGDAANREHAMKVAADEYRRAAGARYRNLLNMLERVEREDSGDLRRLLEEGASFMTQFGEVMTELTPGEWVTAKDTFGRESFLRRLRSRLEDLGRVDEQGRFYGTEWDTTADPGSFEGRLSDVSRSLSKIERLITTQRGEVPVVYGSEDAWADTTAAVVNAMSMGTGAEVEEALERGAGAVEVVSSFGHGLLNVVTMGGLKGAEKGLEDYWSRGRHDFGLWDHLKGIAYAGGAAIAHVADNTVIPFTALSTLLGPDSTPGQRLAAGAQIFLTENALRERMGGKPLKEVVVDYLEQRKSQKLMADPRLPRIGPEDPLSKMPTTPVERGTYVRNILRDQKVRESLVKRMGYEQGPPPADGKVRLGRTFPGETPYGRVYDAAFRRGRHAVQEAALHELKHVQQLDQAKILAAKGGPLEHYQRGPNGSPTVSGNRRMEMQVRMEELDRNLRLRDESLRRVGLDERAPMKDWPAKAKACQAEVRDARQALDQLLERDRQVRDVARSLEKESLNHQQQQTRIQNVSADIENIRNRLNSEYGETYSHEPGARKLVAELEARRVELEARQARLERQTGCEYNESTGSIEKFTRAQRETIFERNRDKFKGHDGYTCECCRFVNPDEKYFDADHIDPESRGGLDAVENGRVLCTGCNRSRGNRVAPKPESGLSFRFPSENHAPPKLRPRRTVKDMSIPEFERFSRDKTIYDRPDGTRIVF